MQKEGRKKQVWGGASLNSAILSSVVSPGGVLERPRLPLFFPHCH